MSAVLQRISVFLQTKNSKLLIPSINLHKINTVNLDIYRRTVPQLIFFRKSTILPGTLYQRNFAKLLHHKTTNSKMGSNEDGRDNVKENIGSLIVVASCIVLTQAIAGISSDPMSFININNRLAYFTIAVQWLVFIHAAGFFGNVRTEKYYDLTGSITYLLTLALSTFYARDYLSARQITLSVFVAIWCIRLGFFLFRRIANNNGVDSRFTEIKKNRCRFLVAWTLQGVWVFLIMLPINILNQNVVQNAFNAFDYVGIPLWVIGFLIEVISDYQKDKFRSNPLNKDKFISTGLWSISRHPNYFGEILLWSGLALSSFGGLDYESWRSYLVFLSPLFTAFLLVCVSGIPLLEKKSDERFGTNEEYIKYKKNTPVLLPFIGRRGNFTFCKI